MTSQPAAHGDAVGVSLCIVDAERVLTGRNGPFDRVIAAIAKSSQLFSRGVCPCSKTHYRLLNQKLVGQDRRIDMIVGCDQWFDWNRHVPKVVGDWKLRRHRYRA